MPIYNIRGINVDFPYEAYDCQIVYMEKVIQSLQDRCNALLESPTGTGKTLCLLCSTLAWRKSLGDFSTGLNKSNGSSSYNKFLEASLTQNTEGCLPTIIYTSRTHSQLQQVIRELKKTNYRPKIVILGSREQMCIHRDVQMLRGRAQNNACHSMCKKRSCFHHTQVADYMKKNPDLGNDPMDIEDLVNIGRNQGPCPYYVSRELHKLVDILFAPYNYLIDPGNRRSLSGIQWQNTVLIFDEAHNLENICADAASFDLPLNHLSSCISEAKQCIDLSIARQAIDKSDDKALDPDNFAILKALLSKLEKRISEVPIKSIEMGFTRPGPYIYELLAELNITNETANMLMDTIDHATFLLGDVSDVSEIGPKHTVKGTVCRLESIRDILQIIFRDGNKNHSQFYRVHVQESKTHTDCDFREKISRTLSWWCFNPGITMEEFVRMGARSIILTSGTLSPLDSFAEELKLEFPVRLENPHVISPNQVWVGVVPVGPSGRPFNSSYRNRDSLEYKQELGNAIVNFSRIVPDGLLVFFPSYYLMGQCIDCWKNMGHASSINSSTIWERICKHKQPIVEPKQASLFSHSIEDFKMKINDTSTSGCIFFAVCRGKVSEGLDFADHAGRAVVITGMPFPMRTDPKIRLKREYLDQHLCFKNKLHKVLTGEEWYTQQAARAVNQAVGRIIRHRSDYGAIIFCDERFAHKSRQTQMSLWLQPHVKCYSKFGDVVITLTRFFKDKITSSATLSRMQCKEKIGIDDNFKIDKSISDTFSEGIKFLATTVSVDQGKRPLSVVLMEGQRSTFHSNDRAHINESNLPIDFKVNCATKSSGFLLSNQNTLDSLHNPRKCSYSLNSQVGSSTLSASDKMTTNNDAGHLISSSSKKQKSSEIEHTNVSTNQRDSLTSSSSSLAKGSAFLSQVKKKLSNVEYKEFVDLMKALKLKTMSISPVLSSIVRLFCTPDRLLLLKRFKDYVPSKYHDVFEEHLKTHGLQLDYDSTRAENIMHL